MPDEFSPIRGAQGWQQSNPSMLNLAALQGSLEIFKEAGGMGALCEKSLKLTGYFADLLRRSPFYGERFEIITSEERGCQLSLLVGESIMERVFDGLKVRGVIGDERRPDVIRLAPTPLYNTFEECWMAARALDEAFESI
jgi:kynureninase